MSLKASAETPGSIAVLKDLVWHLHGEVWGDASAALGIIQRTGLGKTRHTETGPLGIQRLAGQQRLKFGKVFGIDNPADLFIKCMDERTNTHHTRNLCFRGEEGRPDDAPNLHSISISIDAYQTGANNKELE